MGGIVGLAIGGILGGGASHICGEHIGGISLASVQTGLTLPFTHMHSHEPQAAGNVMLRTATKSAARFIIVHPQNFKICAQFWQQTLHENF
jgi:hypothetical protein